MYIEIQKQDEKKIEEIGKNETRHYYQMSLAHFNTKRFPLELRIKLNSSQQPYPEGFYELDDSCFSVNRFDYLEYNQYNFKLVRVEKPEQLGKKQG